MNNFAAPILACVLLLSGPAFADDKEKAKEHFLKGKALVDEGSYEKAIVELKASHDLEPVPMVLYNIGVCYDKLGMAAEAFEYFSLYLQEGADEPAKKIKSVQKRVMEIKELIGKLRLVVSESGAEVFIDDKFVGQTPLDLITLEKGDHGVLVRMTGFAETEESFTITAGETTDLSIDLVATEPKEVEAPTAAAPAAPEVEVTGPVEKKRKKPLGPAPFWSMVGVTGASAVAMIVTGSLALTRAEDVEAMFDDENWKPVARERDNLALGTNILIGAASAAAAASLILFFFTDFRKGHERAGFLGAGVGPGSVQVGYEGVF